MAISSDVGLYVTQWLQTATKGNVLCQKSLYQDRLLFICQRCGQKLTTTEGAIKSDGTVDRLVQTFVWSHAHTVGINPVGLDPLPTAVTADFKKIDSKQESDKIDLKPEEEQKIKANLDAYNQSIEKALNDKVLAAKIAELQQEYNKKTTFKPLPMKTGGNALKIADDDLAKTKAVAVENVLKIKVLQQHIKDHAAKHLAQETQAVPVMPVKKDKVLEQPVGRKFR